MRLCIWQGCWLWPLVMLAGGCASPRSFDLTVKNLGQEKLAEVGIIGGRSEFGFGWCLPGSTKGVSGYYSPPLDPAEPWTLVWRDSRGKLHTHPLATDPRRISNCDNVIIAIHSSEKIEVIYKIHKK